MGAALDYSFFAQKQQCRICDCTKLDLLRCSATRLYAVICFTRRTGTRDLHRSLPWAETTTTASKTLNTLHLILLSFTPPWTFR